MVARASWQGFETEFRSPNSCSWPTKQFCACKTHLKWPIYCCGGSKRQDCIFLWHWAPSIPVDFCRSSTPYSRWDPDAHQTIPCTGNLDTDCNWEPWHSVKKCWPGWPEQLGHRACHRAHQKVKVVAASVMAMLRLWYVDNQLRNQEQISFPYIPFHGLFTVVFSLPFSIYVLVVSTTALLCLSSLGTLPFTLLSSVFFLSASFVSLLFLSCFSSFLYWLFSLTAGDWAKACWSQSITFKEFRIKVLFPLASLLLLQSLFPCSVLCGVSLLKDGLLQYAGKEGGLERENPKDLVNSLLNC